MISPDPTPLEEGPPSGFVEIRYSLPELMRDVKRDKTSVAFAMEKLDQGAINTLFEQQRSRRDPGFIRR
jgi:hypothetical protein